LASATGPPGMANPPYHPDGPPGLADLGLRRWYTYLVYPQHREPKIFSILVYDIISIRLVIVVVCIMHVILMYNILTVTHDIMYVLLS
jgi:hypothetical protein